MHSNSAALLPPAEVMRSDSALVCVRFAALASMAVREKLPLPYACTATGGAAPPMDETLVWAPSADTACLRERDRRRRKQLERRNSGVERRPPRHVGGLTSQLYPNTILPSSVQHLIDRFSSKTPATADGSERRAGGLNSSRAQAQRASGRRSTARKQKSKPRKSHG